MASKKTRMLIWSALLALVPLAAIFLLLPPQKVGRPVNVRLEHVQRFEPQIFYVDLNGDNISERVDAVAGEITNSIHVTDNDFKIYEQWNLPDLLTDRVSRLHFTDYDHDRFREIVVFSINGDSVFLNINEFFEPSGLKTERLLVARVGLVQGTADSNVDVAGTFDRNGDGRDELYFGINSGFSLQPRLLYSLDLRSHELISSPYTSINIIEPEMADIDGDGRLEIFGWTSASGNHHVPTPYSDYSAWIMVYDDQLQFKFPPIEIPGFGVGVKLKPFTSKGQKYFLTAQHYSGTDTVNIRPELRVYDGRGNLLAHRLNSSLNLPRAYDIAIVHQPGGDGIVIAGNELMLLDEKLDIQEAVPVTLPGIIQTHASDIDGDGNEELLVHSAGANRLQVFGPGLALYGELTAPSPITDWKPSHFQGNVGEKKLHIKSGDSSFFITLDKKNEFYWLGYLIYPAIYFFMIGFIYVLRRVNTLQVEKREAAKRKLLALQLQGVKGQLNPHFTFNALNAVAALVYMDDRKAAYDQLNNFTRLLSQILADAERPYRTLDEELKFVRVYLELEKLRFGNKFNFDIEVGEGVLGNERVPILSIQTFAENAIKHGLMRRPDGGLLKITAKRKKEVLLLTVEDNGVGRRRALELNPATGRGLKIIAEFHDILNQMSHSSEKITHRIVDLFDADGIPAGTRVEVFVPVDTELAFAS